MVPSSVVRILQSSTTAAIKRRRCVPVSYLAAGHRIYDYRHHSSETHHDYHHQQQPNQNQHQQPNQNQQQQQKQKQKQKQQRFRYFSTTPLSKQFPPSGNTAKDQHEPKSATATTTATASATDELPFAATTGTIASHLAPIPTERDLALVGGVFALTSAKRDKLGELKNNLSETDHSLDDLATEDERLDLCLADGLLLVVGRTDSGADDASATATADSGTIAGNFAAWLEKKQHTQNKNDDGRVSRTALEIELEHISAKLDNLLGDVPASECLEPIRDYLDPAAVREELLDAGEDENLFDLHEQEQEQKQTQTQKQEQKQTQKQTQGDQHRQKQQQQQQQREYPEHAFRNAVTRYRLLLARAAIDQISKSWTVLTTVSDGDIDRAAAEGIAMEPQRETVSLQKVLGFLVATVSGSCSDRLGAAWELLDCDGDGALDEAEMNHAVHLCLETETEAIRALFEEALETGPVRGALGSDGNSNDNGNGKPGWRQRRREKKTKKQLLKIFQRSCKRHFDVEIEIHHRLRCAYAWANKADQGNQIRSVLVDEQQQQPQQQQQQPLAAAASWTAATKRYVELSPKISEAEFREVQSIHLQHLDRIGTELATSFRQDLWVLQGKGRERKDLVKNSFLFLAGVSAVDALILML
eukprot:CAMPEP_0172410340 /NCGR_PEP_ID=MMETSP1061-20121228/76825_1 /TAXON_ID=37318 /ORGANISM="Pseudo-nitzschia pungens, Strain cf. pungens" /LENGTH=643 /DNA_ID=CAMNT_0013146515 /DNA_START=543 /DNA_END=2474 /DNA_ORIENTATION=+